MSTAPKESIITETAAIISIIGIAAFLAALSFEYGYLGSFNINYNIAELVTTVTPITYVYALIPLATIFGLVFVSVTPNTMEKFHMYFSKDNPNRVGVIVITGIFILLLLAGFAIDWLGLREASITWTLIVYVIFYGFLILELWLYKKSPAEMLKSKHTREKMQGLVTLVAICLLAMVVIQTVCGRMGSLMGNSKRDFVTFQYHGQDLAVIRNYSTGILTAPYKDGHIVGSNVRLLTFEKLEDEVLNVRQLKSR